MKGTAHPRRVTALAVAFLLVLVPAVPAAGHEASTASRQDVVVRDKLIAEQESLLNVYRCRLGIDTGVVPGGCKDGMPTLEPTEPGVFDGTPTWHDIVVRDDLIANQETILNYHRCRFNIDTHLVLGGCRPLSKGDDYSNSDGTVREVRIDWVIPQGCLASSPRKSIACSWEHTVQLIGPWGTPPFKLYCINVFSRFSFDILKSVLRWEEISGQGQWLGTQNSSCRYYWQTGYDWPTRGWVHHFNFDDFLYKFFVVIDGIKSNELYRPR